MVLILKAYPMRLNWKSWETQEFWQPWMVCQQHSAASNADGYLLNVLFGML